MRELTEAIADIMVQEVDKDDYNVTTGDFIDSLVPSPSGVAVKIEDEAVDVNKRGFNSFVRNKLHGNTQIVGDSDISFATKLAYLREKGNIARDEVLAIRRTGPEIDAILPQHHVYFNNSTLALNLNKLSQKGVLPPMSDMYAHTYWNDGRNMFMRIVAPDHWNFKNGDTYYGGISFNNNERENGTFEVSPALARISCFNYCIAENTMVKNPNWSSEEDVLKAMEQSVKLVSDISELMFERVQQGKTIELENPEAVFNLLSQRHHFPTRVEEDMWEYYDREGEGNSVFDIVQAITYGTQAATNVRGRKKPKFTIREKLEREAWQFNSTMCAIVDEGSDPNQFIKDSELLSKRKVYNAMETYKFNDAAEVVAQLEADDWR